MAPKYLEADRHDGKNIADLARQLPEVFPIGHKKLVGLESKKIGGNRSGGRIEDTFVGELWIGAGSHSYKFWVDHNKVKFQRFDAHGEKESGGVHKFDLGQTYRFGRSYVQGHDTINDGESSGRHFTVQIRPDGSNFRFTLEDTASLNGTMVEYQKTAIPDKETVQSPEGTVRSNLDKIFSDRFKNIVEKESIGGNAGPGYAAVNCAVDNSGRILELGNIQNLPPDTRERLSRGDLYRLSIGVKADSMAEGPDFNYLFGDIKTQTPKNVVDIIEKTIQEANKRGFKYLF
ncbi:MAG: FHA domain-containing protein [Candidatus Altiarchaeota archaeon]